MKRKVSVPPTASRSRWVLVVLHLLLSVLSASALKHTDSNAPLATYNFTIIFGYAIYNMLHYSYPNQLPAWCEVFASSLSTFVKLLTLILYINDVVTLQTPNDQSLQSRISYSYVLLLIITVSQTLCSQIRYYVQTFTIIPFVLWNLVIVMQIQSNNWQEYSWYSAMIMLLIFNNVVVRIFFYITFSKLQLEVYCVDMVFFTMFAFKSLNELASLKEMEIG